MSRTGPRPPEDTRFKAGQSGNPRGRPKQRPTSGETLSKLLGETLVVEERGTRKRYTRAELGLRTLVNAAGRGDLRATRLITQLQIEGRNVESASKIDFSQTEARLVRLFPDLEGKLNFEEIANEFRDAGR